MSLLWPGREGCINYISSPPNHDFISRYPRSVVILGSTGSIGTACLDVISRSENLVTVCGLACGGNITLLARQAARFRPAFLCVKDEVRAARLRQLLPSGYQPRIFFGPEGYASLASVEEAEVVVSALVGIAGLGGTIAAALAGKVIALANKESLVTGGSLLRRICKATGAAILPVDSEHYAIFCCLAGRGAEVKKIVLTASGGPFRGRKKEDIYGLGASEALRHPTWKMGAKITVDSATLMNKGLEVIEAVRLFGIAPENVQVLIHPQSIVHSLVMFRDNAMLGQFAVPDMRLPIAGCLCWPRSEMPAVEELDLARIGTLTFDEPDLETFPCLALALSAVTTKEEDECLDRKCIALNASNEVAVQLFLENRCSFGEIGMLVKEMMRKLPEISYSPSGRGDALELAEDIRQFDNLCRKELLGMI